MAFVFAGLVPHSPLLIPRVGGEHHRALVATTRALTTLATGLRRAKPETLILISPHVTQPAEAVSVNLRPTYRATFEEFGDYSTQLTVSGDVLLADALKQAFDADRQTLPVTVVSQEQLDYGAAAALAVLFGERPGLPTVALGDSLTTTSVQLTIGEHFGQVIAATPRRIAVIASANFSHRLSPDSPAGYSPRAATFDHRVFEALRKRDVAALTYIRPETLQEVQECGLRPLLLLCGMLTPHAWTADLLCYEHPFGIGHATIHFGL